MICNVKGPKGPFTGIKKQYIFGIILKYKIKKEK